MANGDGLMVDPEKMAAAAERLRVYDVEQGAWEHEGAGFEISATHVLLHLTKDLTGKDFSDRAVAAGQIAPDSLQYGLRLVRWTGQESRMAIPPPDTVNIVECFRDREDLKDDSQHRLAFMEGAATIARQLHNQAHESTRAMAATNEMAAARRAGRLLVFAAATQAGRFDFDMFEAFDARLVDLRKRFGIPEPEPAMIEP